MCLARVPWFGIPCTVIVSSPYCPTAPVPPYNPRTATPPTHTHTHRQMYCGPSAGQPTWAGVSAGSSCQPATATFCWCALRLQPCHCIPAATVPLFATALQLQPRCYSPITTAPLLQPYHDSPAVTALSRQPCCYSHIMTALLLQPHHDIPAATATS